MSVEKVRLDKLLVDRGITPTREKARALILAKTVKINETYPDKAGILVPVDAQVQIKGEGNPYVSRGGLKLKGALEEFKLDISDFVVLDVGASTGGFTDCLLQAGACKVYALDVGYGQLAWKLREDKRVVVIERTNIRYYDGSHLKELPDLATIDVSFISLTIVLPPVVKLLKDKGKVLALIKPQFEAGRQDVGKKGLIKDPAVHDQVIQKIVNFCQTLDLKVEGICSSPLLGPVGNKEFFILLRKN
ncbi:MAG: hemolysin [Deltaproteobacteria bacterium RBG_19FT_COMBO_43_11]|nr:MAG: hemolysin [Deltaproteobacteria bacterium RBG_19FT_COMBO_43_11]